MEIGRNITSKLTASDGAGNDEFGRSVAIDDDTIVIGAPSDSIISGGLLSGSVYVYTRSSLDLDWCS
jgi:hypothetical protein